MNSSDSSEELESIGESLSDELESESSPSSDGRFSERKMLKSVHLNIIALNKCYIDIIFTYSS